MAKKRASEEDTVRFADMFSAMGTGPRLRIMRVLLSAHPDGMFAGEIAAELGSVQGSTLSHHLDKLKDDSARTRTGDSCVIHFALPVC
jgi:ArsR family transcriptional regulator